MKMRATYCNNVMPIHLEIELKIPRDLTNKVADFQEIMLPFGIV